MEVVDTVRLKNYSIDRILAEIPSNMKEYASLVESKIKSKRAGVFGIILGYTGFEVSWAYNRAIIRFKDYDLERDFDSYEYDDKIYAIFSVFSDRPDILERVENIVKDRVNRILSENGLHPVNFKIELAYPEFPKIKIFNGVGVVRTRYGRTYVSFKTFSTELYISSFYDINDKNFVDVIAFCADVDADSVDSLQRELILKSLVK